MKTFEEALSKIAGNGTQVDYERLKHNLLCDYDNMKSDPAFQQIIRVTLDETIMKMINDKSPTLAIMQALIATAQTFMLIGMEMEKE